MRPAVNVSEPTWLHNKTCVYWLCQGTTLTVASFHD